MERCFTSVQQLSANKSKVTERSHSNKELEHPETLQFSCVQITQARDCIRKTIYLLRYTTFAFVCSTSYAISLFFSRFNFYDILEAVSRFQNKVHILILPDLVKKRQIYSQVFRNLKFVLGHQVNSSRCLSDCQLLSNRKQQPTPCLAAGC